MNARYRIYQVRQALKEKKLDLIFSNPLSAMLFALLAIRAIVLRLIPRLTKMYFIRNNISEDVIRISETNYEFKMINDYSAELNEFVLNRCNESKNHFYEDYSEKITQRMQKGSCACALMLNGQIVSLFFTSNRDSKVEQVNYVFKPDENELCITDIYTLLDYRKKGLYSMLFQHAIDYYRKNGIRTFAMWIMKHNRATIQAQIKLGFKETFRTVSMFTWLGFKRTTVSTSSMPLKEL